MFTTIALYLGRLVQEYRDRHTMRALLRSDDTILRDIGLTRTDIEVALAKPLRIGVRGEARRLSLMTLSMDGLR